MGACVYTKMKSICMVYHLFNIAIIRNSRIVNYETIDM
jgi:hypothetical protein